MPELNSETNIMETLRSKIGESDIKHYLKSTLGGYTKTSVLEYLNMLRKQQQSMADTFFYNQQSLFDEKENLKKSNDALKARLSQIEAEYQGLSQSLRMHELEDEEISVSDIVALKSNISALEDELNKSGNEKSLLEKQIEQHKSVIDDFSLKLGQSEQEKLSIKEILKAEMMKSKNQSTIISRLSGTIEEKDEEIKFLNSLLSDGQLANLTEKVNELTEQLLSQAEILTNYNSENSLKSQTIETLAQENDTLKQRNIDLLSNLDELNYQNSKYLAAGKALTEQLENEYKKSIELIKEKSGIAMDKFAAVRKLDEANSKIMMMELQLNKQMDSENTDLVYLSSNQTEKINSSVL